VSWNVENVLTRDSAWAFGDDLAEIKQRPLPTGIPSWDAVCEETGGKGLGDWWYVVIGGASNAGKTQLALHLARRASESLLRPGLITMEVPRAGIQRRVYSNVTSFGYRDFLPANWANGDPTSRSAKTNRLAFEVQEYSDNDGTLFCGTGAEGARSLHVAELNATPTLDDILQACESLHALGCGVVLVDHLQLIKASADQIADRATEISEALRWFAHGKRLLVIALSQLNRLASRERKVCPTMHDVLGGTSIESNANQVIMLDHSQQARDEQHPHLLRTWLFLDKNREGPNRVRIPVEVNFKTGIWREAMPDEVREWPGGDA